jgi:hypothetical protein
VTRRAAEARRDSMRDVLGLYRAAIAGDGLGMRVIFESTPCLACLAGGAVQIGLWLAASEDGDLANGGYSDQFADAVLAWLAELQEDSEIDGGHHG